MGNTFGYQRKKREPVVAVGNRSSGFPRSGGRVLGVHGSGSFHGPFPILGRAREKTTAQEAPGTTIDRRYDPGYPLLARPQPRGRRPDIRWLRIQAPPISRE